MTFTTEDEEHHQLASPSTSSLPEQLFGKKRRRTVSPKPRSKETNDRYPKRQKVLQQTPQQPDAGAYNPVAHWTRTCYWPKDLMQRGLEMSDTPSGKRGSESSNRSQTLEQMAAHGGFMESSNLILKDSKTLCLKYLESNRQIISSSIFSPTQFSDVLDRVQNCDETRIQRDVTPWVVPSAENLIVCGELKSDYIGEDLNAEWSRCATMRSTKPKPCYTAGLLNPAFTEEEVNKLENYAQPTKPFRFTSRICFPFLMCEAKTGENGLIQAARQNAHSASVAVRAIIMLYQEAFGHTSLRVHQLYGKVLVFSVSHDRDRVALYGHFAILKPNHPRDLKFYRHRIDDIFSLTSAAHQYKSYNFVRDIYEDFAPIYRKRIKDAVQELPRPSEKTVLPFAPSHMFLDKSDSQQDSQERPLKGDDAF